VGKKPVKQTPNPNKANEKTAKVCSLITNKTNIRVKDRKPGTSLRLCKIPISTPVKAAFSTTKLFNIADHALNAIGIAMDININKEIGLNRFLSDNNFFITSKFICPHGYVQCSPRRLKFRDYEI
jgi:hypothetical protein|tara:strand:- start:212 stop:586 length:375 start_codon:yes stop_codon:yes gene_type:complete